MCEKRLQWKRVWEVLRAAVLYWQQLWSWHLSRIFATCYLLCFCWFGSKPREILCIIMNFLSSALEMFAGNLIWSTRQSWVGEYWATACWLVTFWFMFSFSLQHCNGCSNEMFYSGMTWLQYDSVLSFTQPICLRRIVHGPRSNLGRSRLPRLISKNWAHASARLTARLRCHDNLRRCNTFLFRPFSGHHGKCVCGWETMLILKFV